MSVLIELPGLCKQEGPFWSDEFTVYNTENPDFTLCFQYSVLEWIPSAWVLTVCLFYVWLYRKRKPLSRELQMGKFNIFKMLGCVCLAALALATGISYLVQLVNNQGCGAVIPLGSFLNTFTYLLLAVLLHWEYVRGVNSSGPVFLFWLLRLFCTLLQTQSALRGSLSSQPLHVGLLTASCVLLGVEFLAHCFADNSLIGKLGTRSGEETPLLQSTGSQAESATRSTPTDHNPCPGIYASFLNRIAFFWYFPLVLYGYKNKIGLSDCWSLSRSLTSRFLIERLDNAWQEEVQRAQQANLQAERTARSFVNPAFESSPSVSSNSTSLETVKPSLFKAYLRVFLSPFLLSASYHLMYIAVTLIQPVLLNLLINCITHKDPIVWHGYVISGVIFAVAVLRSIAVGQHEQQEWLYSYRSASSLTGLIYRKSLKVSAATKKDYTVGEVINLAAVDVNHVSQASFWTHMIYSAPLTIAVALYQLWQQVGIAALAALGVIIIFIPFDFIMAAMAAHYQQRQMTVKDERLKHITELLNSMKVLKLYGWETSFAKMIHRIRKTEIAFLRKMLKALATLYCGFDCAPLLITVVTILVYVLSSDDNVLDPAKVFVSLQLITIINEPLACFPIMLAIVTQAAISFNRIYSFMVADELTAGVVEKSTAQREAVRFRDASFSWDRTDSTPILKNMNVGLSQASLIAVVGRVGDGKSNLLSSILGEMHKLKGNITINGKIAYVPQQAWIVNASIRENIVFGQEFSSRRYENVLDACALRPDLQMMPNGDRTEIGDRGINLSGGQKQRISLARAVYQADASIYLLDDPLSAVDAHVGRHLFDRVIGPSGVLADKCRVLVTNALFALPSVDYVIVLKKGQIDEMGTYSELMDKQGSFAKLVQDYMEETQDEDHKGGRKKSLNSELEKRTSLPFTRSLSRTGTTIPTPSLKRRDRQESVHEIVGRLIEDEEMEEGNVKSQVYLLYMKAMSVPLVTLSIVGSLGLTAAIVLINWWLSTWSNDVYVANVTDFRELTMFRLTVYGGIGAFQIVCIIIRSFAMALGIVRASKILHKKLLKRIIRAPMAFFDVTPIGRLTNRFSHDMDAVDTAIPDTLPFLTYEVVVMASIVIVIMISAPILVVVVIPILIAYFFAYKLYIRTYRQLKRLNSVLLSPVLSHIHSTIVGITSIRAHDLQKRFIGDFEKVMDNNQRPFYPMLVGHRWIFSVLEVMNDALVLITSLFALIAGDVLTPGLASLLVTYPLQLTDCAQHVLRTIGDVETDMVSVERIEDYSNVETEAALEVPEVDQSLVPEWPDNGVLQFRDYSVRYRAGLDLVLRNINLRVASGEKVGIVGRTGAGKSSLSLALFRLIEPANGSIYIDDVDIRTIGLQKLRTRLTIIPQEPVLFSGPLRVNLDPLATHTDEQVWTALEHAHLKSFVAALPNGLEHECSEGGENLSVGQRQLLCLARALLRHTKILVLDEATAAVDVETDELIQKTIRDKFAGCTILTIAHRINTILDYDRVLVLENGEVKEFAAPSELLQDPASMFAALARNAGLFKS